MSMIDTQNGYDLGYSYCKVCEDWSKVEHDHEDALSSLTAAELVAMLHICAQCSKHGVIETIDGTAMCTSCWKALKVYFHAMYHSQAKA